MTEKKNNSPSPSAAPKLQPSLSVVSITSEMKDSSSISEDEIYPDKAPAKAVREQNSNGCGGGSADITKPCRLWEDSKEAFDISPANRAVTETSPKFILFIGPERYRFLGPKLISLEEAEVIFNSLLSEQTNSAKAKCKGDWSIAETRLLQWIIFNYCSQNSKPVSTFV